MLLHLCLVRGVQLVRVSCLTLAFLSLDLLLEELVGVRRQALQLVQATTQPRVLGLLVLVVGLRHDAIIEVVVRELQEYA